MRMCMCNKNGNVFIFCHVVTLKNDNKREGIISIQLKGRPRGLCNDICDNLTNRMWFSVVCTLIYNDTRHHSSQNVVDSQRAEYRQR